MALSAKKEKSVSSAPVYRSTKKFIVPQQCMKPKAVGGSQKIILKPQIHRAVSKYENAVQFRFQNPNSARILYFFGFGGAATTQGLKAVHHLTKDLTRALTLCFFKAYGEFTFSGFVKVSGRVRARLIWRYTPESVHPRVY